MKSPQISHAVPVSTRSGWRTFEHHILNRRAASSRAWRRSRPKPERHVRDAIEISRNGRRGARLVARAATVGLAALAVVDLFDDTAPIHVTAMIGAVFLAGSASLLAIAAAEPEGIYPVHARRWQLQAVASAIVMFMLMANPSDGAPGDLLWFLIVVGAASTLVAMATSYHDSGFIQGAGGICLAFDSAIVGFTAALLTVSMANPSDGAPGDLLWF